VPAYLAYAKEGLRSARVEFVSGLVERMPFADRSFDCCLSLLVLQEIGERAAALREMRRVTGAGGIVAACQWDFGQGMPLSAAIRDALAAVASGVAESLGQRQPKAFTSEAELRRCWEEAGLVEVETTRLVVTLGYDRFDDLWQPLLAGSTPVTAAVAGLPPDARDAVRRRLAERWLGRCQDGAFALRAEAFAVRGRSVGPVPPP